MGGEAQVEIERRKSRFQAREDDLIEREFNSIVLGFERDLGKDVDVVSVGVMVEEDGCRGRVLVMDGTGKKRERLREKEGEGE